MCVCMFVYTVFQAAHSQQDSSAVVYYGYTRYSGFSDGSAILTGSGTSLSMRFHYCRAGGILLEATGSSGAHFSIGVTRGQQLLVEFNTDGGGGAITQVYTAIIHIYSHITR